jgi:hypothetical protein
MIDDFVRPPKKRQTGTNKIKTEGLPSIPLGVSRPASLQSERFVPPEEVAAEDDKLDDTIDLESGGDPKEPKDHWWNKLGEWWSGLNGKRKALVLLIALVFLAAVAYGSYVLLLKSDPKPSIKKVVPATKVKEVPKSDKVPSQLTGLLVAPDINKIPTTAVMIENSLDARPQSGLYDAGVVFEAIAEGGITRFMALYQDTAPEYVGPVRSVRPYYLDWAQGFDAAVAHVGGSPEALQKIKTDGVVDLDQFYNSKYYQRVSSRYAPHNVYTSISQLNQLEAAKGHSSSTFTSFTRKADAPSKAPNARSVSVNISGKLYNSTYAYDAATNSYLRNENGAPHMDEKAGKQLNPKVIVVIITHYGIQSDGKHSEYGTIGSGSALIFQDGTVTAANWSKPDKKSQISLTDATGKSAALNAGQTWIVSVDSAAKVAYQP